MSVTVASRTATGSLTEIFGVVTTTAAALTTTVDTIGQASKVANMHATRWAERTRKQLALEAAKDDTLLVNDAAMKVITRVNETKQFIARNPELAEDFKALVSEFTAAIKAQ